MSDPWHLRVGWWNAGEVAEIHCVIAVVENAGKSGTVYVIDRDDQDSLVAWLSENRDYGETARAFSDNGAWTETEQEHLARIGCAVTFREFLS